MIGFMERIIQIIYGLRLNAHLAPDHLHDAVANLGFSTQFQHTEKPTLAMDYQNGLVTVINGRGERI
ncbi:uncharacterized protein METZ01_LOCUS492015 [marine metagenome]|uniref:Uncharacterized protein n=1 Tax=marine metagenome TaxID=408172 RepID=A0A383D436_9ZZZZ